MTVAEIDIAIVVLIPIVMVVLFWGWVGYKIYKVDRD